MRDRNLISGIKYSKLRLFLGIFRGIILVFQYPPWPTLFGQKREQWLLLARKLASGFPPCLAVGILLYEEGSYKRDVATILLGSRKEPVIAEAKKLMKRCVDLCCRLDREQVYVRKQHVAVSKMAIMNLHCETSVSRSKAINSRNIVVVVVLKFGY